VCLERAEALRGQAEAEQGRPLTGRENYLTKVRDFDSGGSDLKVSEGELRHSPGQFDENLWRDNTKPVSHDKLHSLGFFIRDGRHVADRVSNM
jgi:hypothetical protein